MGGRGRRGRLGRVLGICLAIAALALPGASERMASALAAAEQPVPCAALSPSVGAVANLAVRVQLVAAGGAPLPPGLPATSPQADATTAPGGPIPSPGLPAADSGATPATGATVLVLWPEQPERTVGEQVVDASGVASFELPAGRYQVVVPRDPRVSGLATAIVLPDPLPDGRAVVARQEVTLANDESVEITLTIVVPLP